MVSIVNGARIQRRVVWALMLRETKTLFGKHKLGYLWVLINASFQIGVFWGLREIAGMTAPHGLSTPIFLFGGFIPWLLFADTLTSCMNGISGNRALLSYPQVFPLDILVARTLLNAAVYCTTLGILLLIANLSGYNLSLHDPMSMLIVIILAPLLGFSVGLLCAAFNVMWPTTRLLVPMVVRILFFTSGIFFSVESAPLYVRNILFYNPISHLIELLRNAMSAGYESSFIYVPYVACFILVSLACGLLLERYTRQFLNDAT